MRRKKTEILILTPGHDGTQGGIQRFSHELIRSLNRLTEASETDFRITVLSLESTSPANVSRFLLSLQSRILFNRPEIIISTHANLGLPFRVPFVKRQIICCHGVEVWPPVRKRTPRNLIVASELWCVSKFTAEKVKKLLQRHSHGKIRYLPNTVNEKRFLEIHSKDEERFAFNIPKSDFIFLTVNRFEAQEKFHSYESFLPAFEKIHQARPDTRWLCAGSGNDLERFRTTVKKSPASDAITLTGFLPDHDLSRYYRVADFFVMPSKLEGFGIVYLEALANGLFCLSGDGDGAAQVMKYSEFGVMCDPDDSDVIASKILTVMNDEDLFSEESRMLRRKKVLRLFGMQSFDARLSRLLKL